jgi:hypothetical protein
LQDSILQISGEQLSGQISFAANLYRCQQQEKEDKSGQYRKRYGA